MKDSIGAYEAKTHLPRLLDRVARAESLTITRHGRPVARLVPVASGREKAREALARIVERRGSAKLMPYAELAGTIREGHRY